MENFTDSSETGFYGLEADRFSKKAVGERLRNARTSANLTLQQVGEMDDVGVKRNTLQQWETGATEASIASIYRLSQLYGVDPIFLLSGQSRKEDNSPVLLNFNEDYVLVPAYNIEVSAGHGTFANGDVKPSRHLALRKR